MGDVKTWTLGNVVVDDREVFGVVAGAYPAGNVEVVPEADYLAVVQRAEQAEQAALTAFSAIAAAEEERDEHEAHARHEQERADEWFERAEAAEAERDRLREALAFYADRENYDGNGAPRLESHDESGEESILRDLGYTARAALGVSDEQ